MEITLPKHNDPYLDNALQSFSRMLRELKEQFPEVLDCQLSPNGLWIKVINRKKFLDVLEEKIKDEIETNLRFSSKRRDGTSYSAWKHFPPFVTNKPSQYPKIYKEETRRELLESAFPEEMPKTKKSICFLCEKFPASEELTQGVYPLVTKIASLTTTEHLIHRSTQRYYYRVCPLCYLVASLGWLDPALPYRSKVEIAPRQSVSFIWLPYSSSLQKLDELKRPLLSTLKLQEEISNVPLGLPYPSYPPSRFSLLLASLESLLLQVAEKEKKSLRELILIIPEEWWFLRVPEGRGMKNVDLGAFSLPQRIKEVLQEYLPQGKIYGELLGLIEVRQDSERRDRNEERRRTDRLREELSRAFLQDDYHSFARCFQIHPRWIINLPSNVEGKLFNLIKIWRCKGMLVEGDLEVLQKAARTIALVSDLRQKPSVLYNLLDRVRTPSDMLSALKEIGHLLVGIDFAEPDAQYLSPDSLEQLLKLLHHKERPFPEVRDTLGIFISVEYAKRRIRERRSEK